MALDVTAARRPLSRAEPLRARRTGWLIVAGAFVLALYLGRMVGHGQALYVAAMLGVGVAVLHGLLSWRRTFYGLLLYLPFSGLLIIATYPNTQIGTLAKDGLFVIPLYAGFFVQYVLDGRRITFKAAPTLALAAFTVLVCGQVLNPQVASITAGLIGAKVWLLYIPLLFVMYHWLTTKAQLGRLLRTMTLVAMIPAVVGIVEAIFIYAGAEDLVYPLYGGAAEAATQGFTEIAVGEGSIRRVPSLFSFVSQYFGFLTAMLPVAYAYWRGFAVPAGRGREGLIPLAVLLLAALLCGQRGAFIYVPVFLLVTLALDRGLRLEALGTIVAFSAAMYAALNVLGARLGDIYGLVKEVGFIQFQELVVDAIPFALRETLLGLGAGANTNAARYAGGGNADTFFEGAAGPWVESFWAKALLELGVFGLVVVLAVVVSLALSFARSHRALSGWQRSVSAPFLALGVILLLQFFKGPALDIDPLNVYFWVFAGLLFKLPQLAGDR